MDGIFEGSLIGEQLKRESRDTDAGVVRYRKLVQLATKRGAGASLKPVELLMLKWLADLIASLREEQRNITAGRPGQHLRTYGPALCCVPADKLAVITMHVALSACLQDVFGVDQSRLCESVGKAVNGEWALPQVRADEDAWNTLVHTHRLEIQPEKVMVAARKHVPEADWGRKTRIQLGACLLRWLFHVAEIDDTPAFDRKLMRVKKKTWWRVRLSEEAMRFVDDGHSYRQYLRPQFTAMVVPPVPWHDFDGGGYLKIRLGLVKHPTPTHRHRLKASDLSKVMAGANALQSAAWSVNRRMLDLMQEIWESGGRVGAIPRRHPIPLPEAPPNVDTDREVNRAFCRQRAQIYRQNTLELGQRTTFAAKLHQAEQLSQFEAFWQPHQLDLRGRIYPVPLYLNHQGDDVCRALMQFAEAKPLGATGERHLKLHLANVAGVKGTINERVGWVEASANAIEGWTQAPLENTGWAAGEIDNPYQTLAAAYALVEGGPTGLPVQMDGTCNALQHYAALGRNREDARRVGLVPGDLGTEPYAAIAEIAAARVAKAAVLRQDTAEALVGHVCRAMVKTPCMTRLYGVTAYGASHQVSEYLRENCPHLDDKKLRGRVARYLSTIALDAMSETCRSAGEIMEWLAETAQAVVDTSRVMRWVTPLGLPVEQPYRRGVPQAINTLLHKIKIPLYAGHSNPLKRRQVQAFAPNFIHSLDSSHLLITAQLAEKQGITTAGVHDSFWTHAADAERLQEIVQDSFFALHRLPILKNLREQLQDYACDAVIPPPPEPGDWDVSDVLDASEAFS